MMRLKLAFISILMVILQSLYAQGEHPKLPSIPVHDPVVIEENGKYYLFCTGRGIAVWSSEDFENWEKEPQVFASAPEWTHEVVPDFSNHIWAPDITYHEGTYYLYYSVSAFAKNTSAIGLVTNTTLDASSPNYKWEDQGIVVRSVPGRDMWNAIDPNLVFDDEGTPWLNYGSFWGGMKLVRLEEDFQTLGEGPEDWYTISRRERSFDLDERNPGDAAVEAPFVFKKHGYYYLFVSFDYCCRGENSTYKIAVGRSQEVQGPYLDKEGHDMFLGGGTIVLEGNEDWHGIGHNSVYTFNGEDYLFTHGYDARNEGRSRLIVETIEWDEDLWPIVKLSK